MKMGVGIDYSLTRACNSIVFHVRVRSGPKLCFGWPWPARREDRRCCRKRRGSAQRRRQTLSLVFQRTKLSVKFLKLSVLFGLKRNDLSDVPTDRLICNAVNQKHHWMKVDIL